jgi:DNA-binding transcriptional LysR family regulator
VSTKATVSLAPSIDPASDAAVLAAAQAYVDAFERSLDQPALISYLGVTTEECACREAVINTINSLTDAHRHLDVKFHTSDMRLAGRTSENADVAFMLSNDEYHVLADGTNTIVSTAPAATRKYVISVRREVDRWFVFFVRQA